MTENAHAEIASEASAEYGEQEKDRLGNAPFVTAGLALVNGKKHKARQIHYHQIYGNIRQNFHRVSVIFFQGIELHCPDLAGKTEQIDESCSIMMIIKVTGLETCDALIIKRIG